MTCQPPEITAFVFAVSVFAAYVSMACHLLLRRRAADALV
jgi:hypothetical protein